MIDTVPAIAAAYFAGTLLKGYWMLGVCGRITAAVLRAHWNVTGGASPAYIVSVVIGVPTIMLASCIVWPVVLFYEGKRFLHPYNAFGTMRDVMRAIYSVHR